MGKAKPRMHDIVDSNKSNHESKQELKAREQRLKKFRAAAFSHTPEQLQARMERLPRHAEFDDVRKKGGRSQQKRRAIQDASDS